MLSILYNKYVNFAWTQESKTKISYPLSLSIVKRHLRLDNDFTDDDNYLDDLIITATTIAEDYIEKDIAKTLTQFRVDDFTGDWLRVNDGNFHSLVSVFNKDDVSIGTIYQTSKHSDFFQIEWTDFIESNPLKVSYYTGFDDNAYPSVFKQAILIKIADLYDNQRADLNWSGLQDNKIFETILNPYRAVRF